MNKKPAGFKPRGLEPGDAEPMHRKPATNKKPAGFEPHAVVANKKPADFEPHAVVANKKPAGFEPHAEVATPVGLEPGDAEPRSQGAEKAEGRVFKWQDATRWSWFALHTYDSDFRFRVSVALEEKRRSPTKTAVDWDTLAVLPDGFALRWQSAAFIRAGHTWWYRVLEKIKGSQDVEWDVRGYHAKPGSDIAPPPPREQVASQASSHGAKRQHEDVVAQASSHGAKPQEDAAILKAPVFLEWPKYKTRRLIGGWTGDHCPVGLPAGAYKYQQYIGRGAYGQVYRCKVGGQDVAIKRFEPAKKDFALQEASIAQQLCGHPHICDLLDTFRRQDKFSCLVYAFAGQSVADVLKASRLTPPRLPPSHIRLCVAHALKGIAYMHSLHLYHGDVKPANLLMQGEEQPHFVVADLGNAVEIGRGIMQMGRVTTTSWYRSPEILSGQCSAPGDDWLRADVWALGITMAQVCGLDFFKVGSARIKPDEEKLLHNKLRLMVGTSKGAV